MKSWHNRCCEFGFHSNEVLPWLMSYDWKNGISKLLDPAAQRIYTLKSKSMGCDGVFHDSRGGWALFSVEERVSNLEYHSFFLYSPFTAEVIELPELKIRSSLLVSAAISSPLSTVMVMSVVLPPNYVEQVHMYRLTDKTWKKIDSEAIDVNDARQLVYSENSFYFSTCRGDIHSFDVNEQEWRWLPGQELGDKHILVDTKGDLIFEKVPRKVVWKLDESKTKLMKISEECLENQVKVYNIDCSMNIFLIPKVGNVKEELCRWVFLGEEDSCSCYACCQKRALGCQKRVFGGSDSNGIWIQPPFQRNFKAEDSNGIED